MNHTVSQWAILSALLVQGAMSAPALAATPSTSTNLFSITELPAMTSGQSVLLAEKCGSGACGGKKAADHKCGSEKGKDGDHKCGAGKCGSSHKGKDGEHKCGSDHKAKDGSHKCGTGACGTKKSKPAAPKAQ